VNRAAAEALRTTTANKNSAQIRGRLFRKYVALFAGVVSIALLTNALLEIWFSYQEQKTSLIRIQREQAEGAAARIGQFVKQIEGQLGWTIQLPLSPDSLDQRHIDGLRLLRQVPAITELVQLDANGREQLRVSRLSRDVIGSQADFSTEPKFLEAIAHKVYYGPVYFRRESEPYMTLALAGTRPEAGVGIAEVNLKLIWDVVSQIKVGQRGYAYVVDAHDHLIAHPDIGLVLRNIELSRLAHVHASRAAGSGAPSDPVQVGANIDGRQVLAAYAPVAPLGWRVFVELPLDEAYAPLYASAARTGLLLVAGLALAILAGLFLARNMVVPIQALRTGAARIGGGNLDERIAIKTGDELEALADQFNDMAGRLQESYAGLEQKVEMRTRELAQLVEELRALGQVIQAVNSTLDLQTVLDTIVAKAVQLSGTDAGAIYVYDAPTDEFGLRAAYGMSDDLVAAIQEHHVGGDDLVGRAAAQREPIQVADIREEPDSVLRPVLLREGYRALLVVPLLSPDRIVGALVVRRKEPGLFARRTIDLLQTFAAQSVVALQNAHLFSEVDEKGRQLELANLAKSRFLAAASHDLRQPLHALGLFVAQLRGTAETADRHQVISRVEAAVTAMNELFNDLLDISKLDAGILTPNPIPFPIQHLLERIETNFAGPAREKGLELRVVSSSAWVQSDAILLERILLNLVSNAVRYTRKGAVLVGCRKRGGARWIEVCDTGPGVPEDQQQSIFGEFYQLSGTERARQAGLGLGLAIVDRLCRLLDHRIELTSVVGKGSRFAVLVPAAAPQEIPAPAAQAVPDVIRGKLIVVVDDDTLILDGMRGLLREWGCEVVTASSEQEAVVGLGQKRPDLIISDYRLAGGLTGIEVVERLRHICGTAVPAFLISGDTAPDRLREARAGGLHLLHKPVPSITLRAMLSELLIEGAQTSPAGA
jgi:signal transduction histidine kinase